MKGTQFFIPLMMVALAACTQARKGTRQEIPAKDEQPPVQQVAPPHQTAANAQPQKNDAATKQNEPPTVAPQPAFVPKVPGARIARVSVPGKYVALTFDDGPSAAYTPKVLDILRRHGAKATFFVLGENAARNKGILARAAAEGHEIGSHTWSHIKLTGKSRDTIISEMNRTSDVVQQATGRRPSVMRPPYGATNKAVTSFMMQQYGMPSILWDVDTVDWKHPGVGVVINRAVNGARNGSIILLHDIHGSTLAAVEGVVKGLQARGFKLVTVSELVRLGRDAAGASAPAETMMANTPPPTDGGAEPEPSQPVRPESPSPQPAEPSQLESPAAPEGQTGVVTAPVEPTAPECSPVPEPMKDNAQLTTDPQQGTPTVSSPQTATPEMTKAAAHQQDNLPPQGQRAI